MQPTKNKTTTVETLSEGNLAIQTEVWTLPIREAKKMAAEMRSMGLDTKGGYWRRHALTPVRKAIRNKAKIVKIYTAGFSTSEIAGIMNRVGVEYRRI